MSIGASYPLHLLSVSPLARGKRNSNATCASRMRCSPAASCCCLSLLSAAVKPLQVSTSTRMQAGYVREREDVFWARADVEADLVALLDRLSLKHLTRTCRSSTCRWELPVHARSLSRSVSLARGLSVCALALLSKDACSPRPLGGGCKHPWRADSMAAASRNLTWCKGICACYCSHVSHLGGVWCRDRHALRAAQLQAWAS